MQMFLHHSKQMDTGQRLILIVTCKVLFLEPLYTLKQSQLISSCLVHSSSSMILPVNLMSIEPVLRSCECLVWGIIPNNKSHKIQEDKIYNRNGKNTLKPEPYLI